MGHPEVKWSIVSSCCLHNRHLLSISSFNFFYYLLLLLLFIYFHIQYQLHSSGFGEEGWPRYGINNLDWQTWTTVHFNIRLLVTSTNMPAYIKNFCNSHREQRLWFFFLHHHRMTTFCKPSEQEKWLFFTRDVKFSTII